LPEFIEISGKRKTQRL